MSDDIPCHGFPCDEWLTPEQVVIWADDRAYGPCCALLGIKVDVDVISDVCRTILRSGAVPGRRVSVVDSDITQWVVVDRKGKVLFAAHDVFEVARRYCLIESGELGIDPDAPTEVQPTDAQIEQMNFNERTVYITPRRRTTS